jgi:hypothetical protein
MLDRSIPTREALVHSYKGGFCYQPTVYIFLKCYNIFLLKNKLTTGMSTLQTQEFVYTWLVKIFIKCKNFYN